MSTAERRTGIFTIEGVHIYFEIVGTGPPLVLCHGLGGNHASWWQQLGPFVAAGHQVVTWDQRGFGNSSRFGDAVGPRTAAQDLARLLDHLGLGEVDLLGQSMGGWTAMGFALAQPARLRSLVLTDTLAGVWNERIGEAVTASFRTAGPLRRETLGEHPALGERFRRARPDLAVLYGELSSFGAKPSDGEIFDQLAKTRFSLEEVARLDVRTMLMVGEHDQLCPPAAMKEISKLVPGATFVELPGCGHSPYFEDPVTFNRCVLEFLSEQQPEAVD